MFTLKLEISEQGAKTSQEISLEYDSVSLGVGPANGPGFVFLPSLGGVVSRHHATIYKSGPSWYLRDGNGKPSKNGIWENFAGWVREPVKLEPGQVFVLAENAHGAIRLKTHPIETTQPGENPYEGEVTEETDLSPVTLETLLERIGHLESYLVRSQQHLNEQSLKGHKRAALFCSFLGAMLLSISIGSMLHVDQREQFRTSFLEAVGGPVALGTGLGAIVSMGLSWGARPKPQDDDVLN